MPKFLNNKGMGLIPILVISLVFFIVAGFSYKYLSDNKVLSFTNWGNELAQLKQPEGPFIVRVELDTGCPSGVVICPGGGVISFYINKTAPSNSVLDSLRKDGLDIYEDCNAKLCSPTKVKPEIKEVVGAYQVTFKTTSVTNQIQFLVDNPKITFNLSSEAKKYWAAGKSNNLVRNIQANSNVEVSYSFIPKNGSPYEGAMRIGIRTKSTSSFKLASRILTNGVMLEEYCSFQNCPIQKIIKPKGGASGSGNTYQFDIPVNAATRLLDINRCTSAQAKDCSETTIVTNVAPSGWKAENSSKSLLIRNSQQAVVEAGLLRKVGTTEVYSFIIRGVGESANEIVKTLRLGGINRIDGDSFSNAKTTNLKPIVKVLDGAFSFEVSATPKTLSFYINPFSKEAKFGKIPNGWVVNKNSDGLDKVMVEVEKPAASLISISPSAWQYPSYDQPVLVRIEGANNAFIDTFNKNGMLIVNKDGSSKKVSLKMSPDGKLSSYITLNLVKTQKLVFVNLISQVAEYRYGQSDDKGNYWELIPLAEGGGIKRGPRKE